MVRLFFKSHCQAHYCFIFALLCVVVPGFAAELPSGGRVAHGDTAIVNVDANHLQIQQRSQNTVIHWDTFSVSKNGWVEFQQPNSTAAALNRVTGDVTSSIAGRVTSNGRVLLINPNGIIFTKTAQIDTGSFMASTLDIKDNDFLAGQYQFHAVDDKAPAGVENYGTINVADGGLAALLGANVVNQGIVTARYGQIALGSGKAIKLDLYGDKLLSVAVPYEQAEQLTDIYGNPLSALIDNSGSVSADGGVVHLSAATGAMAFRSAINHSGEIRAQTVTQHDGKIILGGGDKGQVSVSGSLDASGYDAGEIGGVIELIGDKVGLFAGANIDVSGTNGGGTVHIGGDYQDKGKIQTASVTYVDKDTNIKADAIDRGNGGEVIVWADHTTRFYGDISAQGGSNAGDGGFVEVSGKQYMDYQGAVNTLATNGKTGTLLLDPIDILVVAGGADDAHFGSDTTLAYAEGFPGIISEIDATITINNASTTIRLQARRDITINQAINMTNSNVHFTAEADRDIKVNASLTTNNGRIKLEAQNDVLINGPLNSNGKRILVLANDDITIDQDIFSANGDIILTANADAAFGGSVSGNVANIDAGTGDITLQGDGTGVFTNGITLQGKNITVDQVMNLTNVGDAFTAQATNNLTLFDLGITTNNGNIELTAVETTLADATALSAGTGNISLNTDSLALAAGSSLAGTGTLTIAPLTAATTIGLGDGAAGALNLTASELATWQEGFNEIILGNLTAGGMVLQNTTFRDKVLILTNDINVNGLVNLPNAGDAIAAVAIDHIVLNGSLTTNNGNITLVADIDFNGAGAVQGSITTLNSGTADIYIQGGETGTFTDSLLLQGNDITISQNMNLTTAGASFTAQADNQLSVIGNITTNNGDIQLTAADTSINGSTALSAGTGNISLNTDSLALAAGSSLAGTGTLTIAPLTAATTIGLGDDAAGTLNLTASELATLQEGFSQIRLGRPGDTVAVEVGDAAFSDNVLVYAGDFSLTGIVSSTATGDAVVIDMTGGGRQGNFFKVGSDIQTPNGRWLVYAYNPDVSVEGSLSGFEHDYGKHYNTAPTFFGSGFIYVLSNVPPPSCAITDSCSGLIPRMVSPRLPVLTSLPTLPTCKKLCTCLTELNPESPPVPIPAPPSSPTCMKLCTCPTELNPESPPVVIGPSAATVAAHVLLVI